MADFYGTVAGFKAYHNARNNDIAAFDDDDDIAAGLLVSSEWVDGRYRSLFPGLKVGLRDQVREYPRTGGMDIYGYTIPSDTIPREVEAATYEVNLRHLASPGVLSVDFKPAPYKRVSVDGAVSVEYATFDSAADVQTQFKIVGEILAPILTQTGIDASGYSGAIARA